MAWTTADRLQDALDTAAKHAGDLNDALTDANTRRDELETELCDANQTIEELRKEIADLEAQLCTASGRSIEATPTCLYAS